MSLIFGDSMSMLHSVPMRQELVVRGNFRFVYMYNAYISEHVREVKKKNDQESDITKMHLMMGYYISR